MHIDFAGPAGRLEGLFDVPRATARKPPSVRAAVVFAHPHPKQGGTMHTKAVFQGAKGLSRIGCAVLRFNFRGVGLSAGTFDEGAAKSTTSARRSMSCHTLSGRAALGGRIFVRLVGRARDGRRRSARDRAHRHRASGRARTTRSPNARVDQTEVLRAGHSGRAVSGQRPVGVLRQLKEPKELAVIDGASICSTARPRKSARHSRRSLETSSSREKKIHDRRRHRQRGSHARRQSAEGRPAHSRPDDLAALVLGEALRRGRSLARGCRRRDRWVRDAGSRARVERRAHREPSRRTAGVGVGDDGQSLLRVGTRSDRAGAARMRRRRGRRACWWHRVDEPRADGRPHDCAQPAPGRTVPGRVSHDGPGRGEPRARESGSRARSRTRLRSRAIGARSPRSTPAASRTRLCRSRSRLSRLTPMARRTTRVTVRQTRVRGATRPPRRSRSSGRRFTRRARHRGQLIADERRRGRGPA